MNYQNLIIFTSVFTIANGYNSPLKKYSPLFIVQNTENNEDFVCQGVLISPSLILSIGDCARSLHISTDNNDTYVYDNLSNRKYIRKNSYYFIHNIALMKTEEPIVVENPNEYIFKLANDVHDIDYSNCKLQSVESDDIKNYSCASEQNIKNLTKMAYHNYIDCAIIDYNDIRYGDLLTCSLKSNPKEIVLVGFEYHLYYKWSAKYPTEPLSMQFTNLSHLGIIIKRKLNRLCYFYQNNKSLSAKDRRIHSLLSSFNNYCSIF